MAKLLAYYNLCPVNDTRDFLGISADAENGAIINTLGKNIVIITKLNDQKQIRSWSVLEKLSNKVVYDGMLKKYVGVFGQRNIKCWSETDVNLKKVQKIKVQKNVKDLLNYGEQQETLVIFEDGTFLPLARILSDEKMSMEGFLSSNTEIQFSKVFSTFNGEQILTYFTRDSPSGKMELRFFRMESVNSSRINLTRGDGKIKLVGYTVAEGPVLVTIWSDKRIFRRALRFEEQEDGPGQFIAMLNDINVEQPLSVVSVSPDYLAIYGANAGQEGASLILYNLHFQVIRAKQFFKVYFSNSQLSAIDGNILLVAGQTLAVVPFRISQSQLADMVGGHRDTASASYVEKDFINEEDELEEVLEFNPEKNSGILESDLRESFPEVKKKPQNFNKKPICVTSEKKMDEKLSLMRRRNIAVEFVQKSGQTDLQIHTFANARASTFCRQEFELVAGELEAMGASEYEISSRMLTLALASDCVDEARNCLRRYSCIPEKDLVNCTLYALQKGNNDFLLTILSVDFSHEILVEELRNVLPTQVVSKLLEILLKILRNSEVEERPSVDGRLWDGDERIVLWFTAILDAHYHHLVVAGNKKIASLLRKWKNTLAEYWTRILVLRNLSPILYNIHQNKPVVTTTKESKWYTIEVVQLY
ncbi:uncharacterized protein DMENIID0001_100430 [Sergentomyia squamirostris]